LHGGEAPFAATKAASIFIAMISIAKDRELFTIYRIFSGNNSYIKRF